MLRRKRGDLIDQMNATERFKRSKYLLHNHPNALDEIRKGIHEDQKIIAQTL